MPQQHLAVPQQAISNGIARLYKAQIGRGPTKVSTSITATIVVCVLEHTKTPYEETLISTGNQTLVHEARMRFQLHHEPQLVAIVEEATGRRVRTHVPGYKAVIDVATEVFLLDAELLVSGDDGDAVRMPLAGAA
jgi:uncharacterized protein YbcI